LPPRQETRSPRTELRVPAVVRVCVRACQQQRAIDMVNAECENKFESAV
jgi:hypothetical protein